ncbi:MAG: GNAT family N-acetyltransferase [Saprospiraceae bacterium]|nr:GNAT family N-acetyltransferase [Saprospiraceae bacterium]
MQDILIREAKADDIPILRLFEQGVIEAERPFDSTLKSSAVQYYDLNKLMHSEDSTLLVALKGNELIGCGYALIKSAKPYLNHVRYGYMGFMYVKPEFRRLGVNALILTGLKKWCSQQEISEIRLEVYEDNLPAIKAYQKSGFKKHMVEMRMDFSDN